MILCCGEALIDMVPVKDAKGTDAFAPLSGGAIFNTAIALGRLNVPSALLSGVSTDLFGIQLIAELHASNVNTDQLIRSNRPTTLAFVKLTDGHAQYTFYDENSAGRMITADDLPDLPTYVSTLYFGGISLCAEPAARTYETLFLRHAQQRVTMLDPNIRPGFIENEATYRARLDKLIAVADIVKVSDEDLDWIVPTETPFDAKVSTLHTAGAGLVIVTKGASGASAYLPGQPPVNVTAPKVSVADTVGAGDTFNAGFLAKLHGLNALSKDKISILDRSEIKTSLEFASKVAAITVSRSGANPPLLAEVG